MGIYLHLKRALSGKLDVVEFPLQIPKIQFVGILLRCDNDIISLGEARFIEPEVFSNESLDPVSFSCAACPFRCGDPQSCNAQPVFFEYDDKMRRVNSSPQSI